MKKNNLKLLIMALSITVTTGLLVGCGSSASQGNPSTGSVSGTITASGSTALQPLAEQAAKKFNDANPNATINVQGGGSGTGLTQVMQGAVDIGNSDIFAEDKLKPEEAKQLVDHKVAVVGIAIVVNSKVKVDNIKKDDLIKIFTGQITNWKEVGGDDMAINLINRPKSSGTRATFKKYALDGKDEVEGKALTEDSSGAVKKTIETTSGSIGYLASSFVYDPANLTGVKVIKLDNVVMNKDNITSGKYPIWAYEHMYTKGEAKDLTKAFIDYMGSSDAKTLIEKLGYIPTADMKVTR
ncbi:phosphate ABC transporter substrate-binding protein [Candidatus Clostridium radicumherbarum]|uniref:Phosphate-binding protein n=1 Tax=Candidatus Clostridium radicumherbarum TaxID=3381662 RepID=A0ABW8TR69_9CLOT